MTRPPVLLRSLIFLIGLVGFFPFSPVRAQEDAAERRAAIDGMYPVMLQALEAKNFGRARNICDQAIIWEPQNPVHHYNLACIEAQAGGDRLPRAIGALELAVALGFNDSMHLQNDPDLAPLHDDPKFAEIARKVAENEIRSSTGFGPFPPDGPRATTGGKPAPPSATSPPNSPAVPSTTAVKGPASASFREGVPVGLFFMTRYWSFTSTLEKAAWYFAPDGTVFQNLEHGFSREDLAAHTGPRGKARLDGKKLEVTWADGKKTSSEIEREGSGFIWEMGIFTTVRPFDYASEVAGIYEGGESLSFGGDRTIVSRRLELKADGTFTWEGVSFVGTTTRSSRLSAGGTSTTTGRWQLSGYSLIFTESGGAVLRRIVFPYDDDKTPLKPDRMFFGGMMFNRRP